jgi:hypothetical protein
MTVKRGARMAGRRGIKPGVVVEDEGDGVVVVEGRVSLDNDVLVVGGLVGAIDVADAREMTAEGTVTEDGREANVVGIVPRGPAPVWNGSGYGEAISELVGGDVEASAISELAGGTSEAVALVVAAGVSIGVGSPTAGDVIPPYVQSGPRGIDGP